MLVGWFGLGCFFVVVLVGWLLVVVVGWWWWLLVNFPSFAGHEPPVCVKDPSVGFPPGFAGSLLASALKH